MKLKLEYKGLSAHVSDLPRGHIAVRVRSSTSIASLANSLYGRVLLDLPVCHMLGEWGITPTKLNDAITEWIGDRDLGESFDPTLDAYMQRYPHCTLWFAVFKLTLVYQEVAA